MVEAYSTLFDHAYEWARNQWLTPDEAHKYAVWYVATYGRNYALLHTGADVDYAALPVPGHTIAYRQFEGES